jgi:hypothetical protein
VESPPGAETSTGVFDAADGSKHTRPNQASLVHEFVLASCEEADLEVGGDVIEWLCVCSRLVMALKDLVFQRLLTAEVGFKFD